MKNYLDKETIIQITKKVQEISTQTINKLNKLINPESNKIQKITEKTKSELVLNLDIEDIVYNLESWIKNFEQFEKNIEKKLCFIFYLHILHPIKY